MSESIPLYEIVKKVVVEKELYGEVSEEFSFVVRDVELLGMSIVEAMNKLAQETPSENLRELLEGLVITFETGGSLREFFSSKSLQFRERANKRLEVHLKTLEILAEVFVVVFVALPIFLIIMISSMNLLGKSAGPELYYTMYLFLPIGALSLIYVIDLMNVKEDLGLTRVERKRFNYSPDLLMEGAEIEDVSEKMALSNILTAPFVAVKRNYYNSLYFSTLLAVLALFAVRGVRFVFPETIFAVTIAVFCIPLLVAFEYRAWYVRRVEKEIPDLLRQMLSLKDVGMTLQNVIDVIKDSKIGVLKRELRILDAEIEWGATVVEAFIEFVNRVGVSSIRRVISLIIEASQITEELRDVLLISIEDFEHELKLKSDRFVTGFAYLVVVYVSFFTFLYVGYSLNTSFLASFSNFNVSVDVRSSSEIMYRVSIMLAIFSGILAGQLEKGHILSGLKHLFVFLLSTIILFEFILGGGWCGF
nr:type II secretion system F family protein [Archaeoglobus neptunius]